MARARRYEDIPIDDIDLKGHGVARVDGYVLFIEGALPGDRVDAHVRRRRSGHARCRLISVRSTGIDRVVPRCKHFFDCGGCTWQDIPYQQQLELKQRMVVQAFERYAPEVLREGSPQVETILECRQEYTYRNRLDYSFSARRWITRAEADSSEEIDHAGALGFHAPGRFDKVIRIEECHLQPEPTNRIRNRIERFTRERGYEYYDAVTNTGYLRNVVVRTSLLGETMVILVFDYDDEARRDALAGLLLDEFPEITSLYSMINPTKNDDLSPHAAVHLAGAESIHERCGANVLEIHPKSFYQTNPGQAERLYDVVCDWAALSGDEDVLDLYCGIGGIALSLAGRCRRVVGLEIVPEAIDAARANAQANGIANAEFHTGSAEETLPRLAAQRGVPDLVVVDPPRAGLHPDVVETLRKMRPARIIYVSCNPATQAENIAALSGEYTLHRMRPVDMFPHTRHVENVVELRTKE